MRLPDGNGVEVCREIRSRHPEIQCLMLTSFADDEALFDAIMAGAAGYVLKQVRGSDLVDSVRRVAAGQSLLDPSVTAKVLDRLRKGPDDDPGVAQLTDQERRILDLLAEGLTNRQIGERLYLAEKTVKNYVSNLLMKLGMHRRTEAAVYAARLAERRNGDLSGTDVRRRTEAARSHLTGTRHSIDGAAVGRPRRCRTSRPGGPPGRPCCRARGPGAGPAPAARRRRR